MKATHSLLAISEFASEQWGLFTARQAQDAGVSRLDLSRLASAGLIHRISQGVYRDSGAPPDEFEDLRAAWLSADPARLAEERLNDGPGGVTASGATAAALHGIGDLRATTYEFTSTRRRQTKREDIRFRKRSLETRSITIRRGLPVTTVEQTIADLIADDTDLSLTGRVLHDATDHGPVDIDRINRLLPSSAARRYGLRNQAALVDALLRNAQIDPASLVEAANAAGMGALILSTYLSQLTNGVADHVRAQVEEILARKASESPALAPTMLAIQRQGRLTREQQTAGTAPVAIESDANDR